MRHPKALEIQGFFQVYEIIFHFFSKKSLKPLTKAEICAKIGIVKINFTIYENLFHFETDKLGF